MYMYIYIYVYIYININMCVYLIGKTGPDGHRSRPPVLGGGSNHTWCLSRFMAGRVEFDLRATQLLEFQA